jgi:hypothetical protein
MMMHLDFLFTPLQWVLESFLELYDIFIKHLQEMNRGLAAA